MPPNQMHAVEPIEQQEIVVNSNNFPRQPQPLLYGQTPKKSHLRLFLAVGVCIAMLLIGGIGWLVLGSRSQKDGHVDIPLSAPLSQYVPVVPTGWKVLRNDAAGVSYAYPSTWTIKTDDFNDFPSPHYTAYIVSPNHDDRYLEYEKGGQKVRGQFVVGASFTIDHYPKDTRTKGDILKELSKANLITGKKRDSVVIKLNNRSAVQYDCSSNETTITTCIMLADGNESFVFKHTRGSSTFTTKEEKLPLAEPDKYTDYFHKLVESFTRIN